MLSSLLLGVSLGLTAVTSLIVWFQEEDWNIFWKITEFNCITDITKNVLLFQSLLVFAMFPIRCASVITRPIEMVISSRLNVGKFVEQLLNLTCVGFGIYALIDMHSCGGLSYLFGSQIAHVSICIIRGLLDVCF